MSPALRLICIRCASLICCAALFGCATPGSGPEPAARAYAQALREGRFDDAHALLAPGPETPSKDELARRYSDEVSRTARADEIERSVDQLTTRGGALMLVRQAMAAEVEEAL